MEASGQQIRRTLIVSALLLVSGCASFPDESVFEPYQFPPVTDSSDDLIEAESLNAESPESRAEITETVILEGEEFIPSRNEGDADKVERKEPLKIRIIDF